MPAETYYSEGVRTTKVEELRLVDPDLSDRRIGAEIAALYRKSSRHLRAAHSSGGSGKERVGPSKDSVGDEPDPFLHGMCERHQTRLRVARERRR